MLMIKKNCNSLQKIMITNKIMNKKQSKRNNGDVFKQQRKNQKQVFISNKATKMK